MYEYFDNKLKKNTINLAPGEFYSSGDDIVINTVLGSCVAVVMWDQAVKIGGMNHFMLAESKFKEHVDSYFKVERYGLYAMESLINDMVKLGGKKNRFQAKIFGGSAVLGTNNKMDIGADNIEFAEKFLETEKIPIINRDTGGTRARRIYLFPQTFRILLRRVQKSTEFEEMMIEYKDKLRKNAGKGGEAVLF